MKRVNWIELSTEVEAALTAGQAVEANRRMRELTEYQALQSYVNRVVDDNLRVPVAPGLRGVTSTVAGWFR